MEKTTMKVQPSMAKSAWIWGKLGLLSFGGPTAQIALMHRLIVAERRWLNESQFLNALSFCMLLPGPEAMQLAIYTGWRIHGVIGGLIAGLLFVLPGALIMLGLGLVYVTFGTVGLVGAAFLGLKAAIVVIVLQALIRLAQKSLNKIGHWIIAAAGFAGIYIFALPFPLIIGLSALYGFASTKANTKTALSPTIPAVPRAYDTIKTVLIWTCLWWGPLLAIDLIAGAPLLAQICLLYTSDAADEL